MIDILVLWLFLISAAAFAAQCAAPGVEPAPIFSFTVDKRSIFAQEDPAVNDNPADYVCRR